jgi:hypothetical protein
VGCPEHRPAHRIEISADGSIHSQPYSAPK